MLDSAVENSVSLVITEIDFFQEVANLRDKYQQLKKENQEQAQTIEDLEGLNEELQQMSARRHNEAHRWMKEHHALAKELAEWKASCCEMEDYAFGVEQRNKELQKILEQEKSRIRELQDENFAAKDAVKDLVSIYSQIYDDKIGLRKENDALRKENDSLKRNFELLTGHAFAVGR